MPSDILKGYEPFQFSSPFLDLVGPLYANQSNSGLRIGIRIEERHCNRRGTAHGGLLASLADIVLGYTAGLGPPRLVLTTAALSFEFLGSARVGDWVVGEGEVLKRGRRIANASCHLWAGSTRILRASGVFSVSP